MDYQLTNIKDTVVIITGATSGIGLATARALSAQGAKLMLNARGRDRLEKLALELNPSNTAFMAGDCADPNICKGISAETLRKFGQIDIVIACAGIGMFGSILDYTNEDVEKIIQTNIVGTINVIRASLPSMIDKQHGDIIIVSSVAGLRGGANESVYAATKYAQIGFAGSLDRELRSKGIRVSTVCPASTDTNFALGAGRDLSEDAKQELLRPADVAQQILQVLQQPKHLRTQIWTIWPMSQQS